MIMKTPGLSAALSAALIGPTLAAEVEVLHWFTSGGETTSVAELKTMLEDKGDTWKDFAVAGAGGERAMTVMNSRVVSDNSPHPRVTSQKNRSAVPPRLG